MFSVPTNLANQMIAQARNTVQQIKLTGFDIGVLAGTLPDLREVKFDPNFASYPNLRDETLLTTNFTGHWYGAATGSISYIPRGPTTVLLKCFVPADTVEFRFNAVIIHAECDTLSGPFMVNYYLKENPKFNLEHSKGGMRYWFQLMLRANRLSDKFDFSNLTTENPTFLHSASNLDIGPAMNVGHDQAILDSHDAMPKTLRPHIAINSAEQWFGQPMLPLTLGTDVADSIRIGNGSKETYVLMPGQDMPAGYEIKMEHGAPVTDKHSRPFIRRIGG